MSGLSRHALRDPNQSLCRLLIYRTVKEGRETALDSRHQEAPMDPFMIQAWVILFFQVGYYVFVPYMLWMIWQKVRHLPS